MIDFLMHNLFDGKGISRTR